MNESSFACFRLNALPTGMYGIVGEWYIQREEKGIEKGMW